MTLGSKGAESLKGRGRGHIRPVSFDQKRVCFQKEYNYIRPNIFIRHLKYILLKQQ